LGWTDYNNRKERKQLLNAIKAKDAQELATLDLAQNTKIEVDEPKEPDLVPLEKVDDDTFNKLIEDQLNGS